MDPILDPLTPDQRAAVAHRDGPLLVLAGAGSGKTRVITHRIAQLVREGAAPWQVLAITFTNKAAGVMRERAEQLVGQAGAWISTFHSFCARWLRRRIQHLGRDPGFSIFDTDDQRTTIKQVLKALHIEKKQYPPATLLHEIGRAKERLVTPAAYEAQAQGQLQRAVARVYPAYQQALKAQNALDFDDLLLVMLRLIREHPGTRQELHQRFRHILVDEYQDTNHPQYLLVRELAAQSETLCVVGDPDQSIYSWRGADIGNILSFEEDYPGARVIRLEQNWRSTQRILAAAQAIIQNNLQRKEKGLWSDREEGERLQVLSYENDQEEARNVVRQIARRIAGGSSPANIAIFYRVNALSRPVEKELVRQHLPYQLIGAVGFYQRREVKDVLAYLRAAVNPLDDAALLRIINVPTRGIGGRTLERLQGFAVREGISLQQAVLRVREVASIKGRTRTAVEQFGRLLEELRRLPAQPVAPVVRWAIESTGYRRSLESEGTEQAVERLENLEGLVSAAREFDQEVGGDLLTFLEQVSLVNDVDNFAPDAPRVSLMSLHAAKGLEFPEVYILGLEEALLPHSRALHEPAEMEEERRLCYVGITRAMNRLSLTWVRHRNQYGADYRRRPSRFLSEMPEEVCEGSSWDRRRVQTRLGRPTITTRYRDGVGPVEPEPEAEPDRRPAAPLWESRGGTNGDFAGGDRVVHDHYGEGQVLSVRGRGLARRIQVRFDEHGEMTLVLHYANLRKES